MDRIDQAIRPLGCIHEIVLVDDASPDEAWSRIAELSRIHAHVRGIRLSRNFGQHAAINAGLFAARGQKIVVMDCDLQDRPEEIPRLLEVLNDDVQIALASRVDRQDTLFKKSASRAFYRLLGWLTDSEYDSTTANFGAYSRKVIDTVLSMPESDRFFPLLVRWTGFRAVLVTVTHGRREHGRSGYTLRQLIRLATNVALSFSDKPLRLVVKMGLFVAGLAALIVLYSVYRYLAGDVEVAGFTSIVASIWLIGSVILSSVGVVGLYVGRLYNQTKLRPHFIIAERSGT